MSVLHITKDNFEAEVLKSDKPVLLDFSLVFYVLLCIYSLGDPV